MVKIASFNVENLFERPKAFRATDMNVAEPVLAAHKEVNELFKKPVYTDADKARILQLREIGRPAFACPANCVTWHRSTSTRWRRGATAAVGQAVSAHQGQGLATGTACAG